MERLKEFRDEGKLSYRARNELSNSIIMHDFLNVEMARDHTDRSYQWVAFRTERHKGKLGKRKIKEFEKEAQIIDMYTIGTAYLSRDGVQDSFYSQETWNDLLLERAIAIT